MARIAVLLSVAALLCVAGLVAAQNEGARQPQQVFVPPGRTIVKAINAGGEELTGADGTPYEADADYVSREPSDARTNEATLTGGFDADLYTTERFGKHFSYSLDLPKKGTYYTVVLKFAETAEGAAAGQNVFDIHLNGRPLFNGLDIAATAGVNTPFDVPLQFFYTANGKLRFSDKLIIPAQDNQVVLDFVAKTGDAKVSGITVFRGLLQTNEQAQETAAAKQPVKETSFLEENGMLLGVLALVGVVVLAVTYYAKNAPKKLTKADKARKIGQSVRKATSPRQD